MSITFKRINYLNNALKDDDPEQLRLYINDGGLGAAELNHLFYLTHDNNAINCTKFLHSKRPISQRISYSTSNLFNILASDEDHIECFQSQAFKPFLTEFHNLLMLLSQNNFPKSKENDFKRTLGSLCGLLTMKKDIRQWADILFDNNPFLARTFFQCIERSSQLIQTRLGSPCDEDTSLAFLCNDYMGFTPIMEVSYKVYIGSLKRIIDMRDPYYTLTLSAILKTRPLVLTMENLSLNAIFLDEFLADGNPIFDYKALSECTLTSKRLNDLHTLYELTFELLHYCHQDYDAIAAYNESTKSNTFLYPIIHADLFYSLASFSEGLQFLDLLKVETVELILNEFSVLQHKGDENTVTSQQKVFLSSLLRIILRVSATDNKKLVRPKQYEDIRQILSRCSLDSELKKSITLLSDKDCHWMSRSTLTNAKRIITESSHYVYYEAPKDAPFRNPNELLSTQFTLLSQTDDELLVYVDKGRNLDRFLTFTELSALSLIDKVSEDIKPLILERMT